jgi:hypothetical protein
VQRANGCELIAIYVRTSLGGRQWTSPQQMSGGGGVAHNAGIARTSSNHIAWSIFDWESWDTPEESRVFARSR